MLFKIAVFLNMNIFFVRFKNFLSELKKLFIVQETQNCIEQNRW